MCRHCSAPISRRLLLGGALAGAAGLALGGAVTGAPADPAAAPLQVADGLAIRPRAEWGADLPPKGPLSAEDVRFLLVHHSASPNNAPNQRDLIRAVYRFHTGAQKRWNDVAYNFFVGPDGTVWEGRAGSLDGPVRADATGGNQGFAQLVCLLGDFRAAVPPPAMQESLVRLLAYLAIRYDVSTWKGATTTFASRGSNKWRAGDVVTARTIAGHRDMTYTECPGDAAYDLLDDWRRRVHPIVAESWSRPGLQPAVRSTLEAP